MVYERPEVDKRAIPELLLKQQIVVIRRDAMIRSHGQLFYNMRLNNGVTNPPDVAAFEREIIELYKHLKDMILEQTPYSKLDKSQKVILDDLHGLERYQKRFPVSRLIVFSDYLLRKVHDLNLSNLLIKETNPFDEFRF